MANINDVFQSHYLKAGDLGGNAVPVTIERIEVELVGREKDKKLVAYFAGKSKGLVLNKTNSRKIADIASSPETDDWAGIKVLIYPTEVDFQGETVEAIRIKAVSAVVKPKPAPVMSGGGADEDIPFSKMPSW